MTLKTLFTMLGRKNVTLAAGVLGGLVLAAQFPALLAEVKEQIAAVGLGGVISIAVSLWLSADKERKNNRKVVAALYSAPPISPSDEKAAIRALE